MADLHQEEVSCICAPLFRRRIDCGLSWLPRRSCEDRESVVRQERELLDLLADEPLPTMVVDEGKLPGIARPLLEASGLQCSRGRGRWRSHVRLADSLGRNCLELRAPFLRRADSSADEAEVLGESLVAKDLTCPARRRPKSLERVTSAWPVSSWTKPPGIPRPLLEACGLQCSRG